MTTTSHDGLEKTTVARPSRWPPARTRPSSCRCKLKKHGYHDVELKIHSGGEIRTQKRSLAYLHRDTRERGNWEEGKGPIFGMWDWNGGHLTLSGMDRLRVMAALGVESSMGSFVDLPKEEQDFLASIGAKSFFVAYQLTMGKHSLGGKEWDPTKPAEMQEALIKWLKSQSHAKPSKINQPELAIFFAEPLLGPVSYMSLPEYYGDPPYQMTPEERAAYKKHLDQFVIGASAIKKEWPNAKCLMPWGIPSFPIPFLRESKEATALMDGPAIDLILFERMPEMQCHQVTFASTMWQLKQEWLKTGKPWPKLSTIEGVCPSPARPGAITAQQEADHTDPGRDAAGRVQHHPIPGLAGRVALRRRLGRDALRQRAVRAVAAAEPPAGLFRLRRDDPATQSHEFRQDAADAEPDRLLLPVQALQDRRVAARLLERARQAARDVAGCPGLEDRRLRFDGQSNRRFQRKPTFTISPSPCYVRGLTGDAKIRTGRARPFRRQAGSERGARWRNWATARGSSPPSATPTTRTSISEFVKKFPGKFTVKPRSRAGGARQGAGGASEKAGQGTADDALLHDADARRSRCVIPGKASHLGLWVKAASDWGRVVYCLRDAKGERWVSVGKKGEWNVDDVHNWSAFNFDGWRYLTFEMPANAPYDLYREAGTSFWGNYGEGDMVVDLPLTLEKIIVERRTHVIHGTEQLPAPPDDVLLGGLYAEYEKPADKADEAVRLSRLRMPLPAARRRWTIRSQAGRDGRRRRPGNHQGHTAGARIRRPALSRPLRRGPEREDAMRSG